MQAGHLPMMQRDVSKLVLEASGNQEQAQALGVVASLDWQGLQHAQQGPKAPEWASQGSEI